MIKYWLILLLFPFSISAQDISGIWVGYLKTTDNTLPFELAINAEGKENYNGYSHTVFTFEGVDNVGVKRIKLKNKKGNVSLEDGELVYSNYTTPPKRIKLYGNLYVKTSDSLMVLSGTFFTRAIDFRAEPTSFVGTVYLRKQKGFPQTKLIAKLEEMQLLHTLSFAPEQYKKKEEPVIASVTQSPAGGARPVTTKVSEPAIADPATTVKTESEIALKKDSETKPKKREKGRNKDKDLIAKKESEEKEKQPAENQIAKKSEIREQNPTSDKIAISPKKEIPSAPLNAAVALAQRKTEIIRNVFFNSDSIMLSLYDNGTVDGDTVSVVLNGEVILAKKALTENAIRTTVHIPPYQQDSLQLIMYAENLGAIPPNTGVLVIQDGSTRTEIRFVGDMQKSSGVILKRRR